MRVSLSITGVHKGAKKLTLADAQTVKNLNLVPQTLDYEALRTEFPHLSNLPITSYSQRRPKILIGLNNWNIAVPLKVREGGPREPIAAKSRLGWSVFRGMSAYQGYNCNFHILDQSENNNETLEDLVKHYFSIESLRVMPPDTFSVTRDAKRAQEIMQRTLNRVEGRFEIGLLWKHDTLRLPNSEPMARQRFWSMERRLSFDPNLKKNLDNQITEYLKKN